MKKLLLLSALLPMLFAGCSKEKSETDPRDQYVGNYTGTMVGAINLYVSGALIGTIPMNESGNATVTKSGTTELNVAGFVLTLSGNKLLPASVPFTQNSDGVSMSGTMTSQGTVSTGIITITSTVSGVATGNGNTGTISGTLVSTFTKN
jgi:hypothetical protein